MTVVVLIQGITGCLIDFLKLQFVLSGFAQHLASHFNKSFSTHGYGHEFSNDLSNYFASYSANSESLVKYAG
jgi:hypothetical protein